MKDSEIITAKCGNNGHVKKMYHRFPCIQAFRDVDTICDFFSLQTGVERKTRDKMMCFVMRMMLQ